MMLGLSLMGRTAFDGLDELGRCGSTSTAVTRVRGACVCYVCTRATEVRVIIRPKNYFVFFYIFLNINK